MTNRLEKLMGALKIAAVTAATSVIPVSCSTFLVRDTAERNAMIQYSQSRIELIAKEYSKDYGIKIKRLPRLETQVMKEGMSTVNPALYFSYGDYDIPTGTIKLDPYNNSFPEDKSGLTTLDRLLHRYNDGKRPVEEALKHEFGHFYSEELAKDIGMNHWQSADRFANVLSELDWIKKSNRNDPNRLRDEARKLVSSNRSLLEEFALLVATSEGISEYLRLGPNVIPLENINPPDIYDLVVNDHLYDFAYTGSYFLFVKDILQAGGVERGVKYLVSNPPTKLATLEEYKQHAVTELVNAKLSKK